MSDVNEPAHLPPLHELGRSAVPPPRAEMSAAQHEEEFLRSLWPDLDEAPGDVLPPVPVPPPRAVRPARARLAIAAIAVLAAAGAGSLYLADRGSSDPGRPRATSSAFPELGRIPTTYEATLSTARASDMAKVLDKAHTAGLLTPSDDADLQTTTTVVFSPVGMSLGATREGLQAATKNISGATFTAPVAVREATIVLQAKATPATSGADLYPLLSTLSATVDVQSTASNVTITATGPTPTPEQLAGVVSRLAAKLKVATNTITVTITPAQP